MRAGRFACVALPIILTVGAIIAFLVATLSGVVHNSLYMFTVNLEDMTLDEATLSSLADNLGIDTSSLSDLTNSLPDGVSLDDLKAKLPDGVSLDDLNLDNIDLSNLDLNNLDINDLLNSNKKRADASVSAADLNLGQKYEIGLWGYCEIKNKTDGDGTTRDCINAEFDWANKHLRSNLTEALRNQIPDEVENAIDLFSTMTRYTEIVFIVALAVFGLELFLGIFASCTRIVSCLVWLIGLAAIVLSIAAAGMATAMSAIVIGTIEASAKQYGVHGSINTQFLATIWIGCAFAVGASVFWLFTICCCKPEHNSHKNRDGADDHEKLMGNRASGYYPIGGTNHHANSDHEMTTSTYHNQFQPTYGQAYSHTPAYSSSGRSDAGYEPYAHRN
ncbi:uncharacterized protein F5Z01DRAFT_531081 [Emericellopsis atlantica]|uniref:Integral membrane protein n=1 Tax=Emericellopsis atlantica TaxID=2614577 RepID=A0A9P8CQJ0_9HYPO|nr:uncharacterized protein F5Z01DRAFT_531081 [Emericellopsis atlantica]KAG9255974.1 integral membrane protein [Emericellopsis atlantica]